ncbi:carboxylesterase/lipase family protein [uncultured Neglectibacter sp.]|uniref:carboxylesterase/lipase family protein n=1 Tax=uncultured Neglectibacter sp. TaxID=1924108 RepID=UPI0034DE8F79
MGTIIKTKYGELSGVDHGWYTEYRGIPYAKPPVGKLRWKAPQEPEPFDGVYQAVDFRQKCVQSEGSSPPWDKDFYDDPAFDCPVDEDCLYLHIWAPKDAAGCPVAFWIHGGAFMGGWSSEKEFDGAAYCRRGVIFVSVEYRCNVFGFLAHPWLTEEAGTSGNYGTLDQIAALNWVHENIAAFGGDPANITVFGQSAGAMSTQTLISSPLTENKIAKAILQSGGSYGNGLHRDIPLSEQESYGLLFSEVLHADSLVEMRAAPAAELLAAIGPFFEKAMPLAHGLFLTPTIDGTVLTGGYYDLIDQGKIKDIPYMLGCTKDDIMTPKDLKDPMEDPLYQGSVAFSHQLEKLGRDPAYVYYFTRDLPGDEQGAWHSSELWYMMGTMDRCWRPWTPEDYALSAQMLDYWCNFMKTGDPNGESLPQWKPCAGKDSFVKKLDVAKPVS